MTCRLDSFCLWRDVVSAWGAMVSITLTDKLNRPVQLRPLLAPQPLKSSHFEWYWPPTWTPEPSKVMVSLQRGAEITKSHFPDFPIPHCTAGGDKNHQIGAFIVPKTPPGIKRGPFQAQTGHSGWTHLPTFRDFVGHCAPEGAERARLKGLSSPFGHEYQQYLPVLHSAIGTSTA